MIKAVIFDFDGVIVDTLEKVCEIFTEVSGKKVYAETIRKYQEGNIHKRVKGVFSKEDVKKIYNLYKERAAKEDVFPIKNEIKKLDQRYLNFIVSSSTETGINRYLELSHLSDFFEGVLGAETGKSKVKKFKMIFDRYNLKPEQCISFTDTTGDVLEGKEVSLKTVAVTWGFHERERLVKSDPELIIDNFSDIVSAVERLNLKK